jgi:hypothetical protein
MVWPKAAPDMTASAKTASSAADICFIVFMGVGLFGFFGSISQ